MPDYTKDALTLLEEWNRKHYHFKVQACGNTQPGSGPFVELTAAGRTVTVGDYELVKPDPDDETQTPDQWPTLEELIKEAIRRWHADTSPKHYRVLFHADYLTFDAVHHSGDKYMAKIEATGEDEARKKLHDHYPPHENQPEIIQVWEVNANGNH
jgi:hypothetical protein